MEVKAMKNSHSHYNCKLHWNCCGQKQLQQQITRAELQLQPLQQLYNSCTLQAHSQAATRLWSLLFSVTAGAGAHSHSLSHSHALTHSHLLILILIHSYAHMLILSCMTTAFLSSSLVYITVTLSLFLNTHSLIHAHSHSQRKLFVVFLFLYSGVAGEESNCVYMCVWM